MSSLTSPVRVSPATGAYSNEHGTASRQGNGFWSYLGAVALLSMILFIPACGGGGGGSSGAVAEPPPGPPPTGSVQVGITDGEGDFVAYVVDVVSIKLAKSNGDTVETLPLSTTIDFAQLTEVTEFISIATVPTGNYNSAELVLDYTNAEILVQDGMGNAVAANVVDVNGDPITMFTVTLMLTNSDVIRVAAGIPAAFSLDFDLDASNEIDLTTAPPTVTVDPFLLATPELETDRAHRVRGVLAEVNEPDLEITLKVRPFRHRQGDFGRYTFNVDDITEYEIDGLGYTGAEGLTAMAALAEDIPVVAGITITDSGPLAFKVLAGTSVPWSDTDVVVGVVAARSGDVLTVRGGRVLFRDGTDAFRGEFEVIVADTTVVNALGFDTADLNKDSISVGQRVTAFGELLDDGTIDASNGRVRMRMNQLTAQVVQADPLAVDVFFLNGRHPEVYDFSGTGISTLDDADPDFYEIDTAALGLSGITDGDLIRVRGLVNDFGMAPADYNARTVIDIETDVRGAHLGVAWDGGTSTPFLSIAPARLDVDLSEARHLLKLNGVPRDFNNPIDDVALVANAEDRGVFAVKVRGAGEIHLYRSFSAMVTELSEQLDSGNLLHRIGAHGRYNSVQEELTTRRAAFVFSTPDSQ